MEKIVQEEDPLMSFQCFLSKFFNTFLENLKKIDKIAESFICIVQKIVNQKNWCCACKTFQFVFHAFTNNVKGKEKNKQKKWNKNWDNL